MANESTKWLYDQLKGKGYNVGKDVEEFDGLMRTNADSRRWAYDTATKSGLNVGRDIDEFSSLVGGPTQQDTSSAPVAPVEGMKPTDTQPEQQAWQPTPMQKAFMSHAAQSAVDSFKANTGAVLDQIKNQAEYIKHGEALTGHPVKIGVKMNLESGQPEQKYLTPAGGVTTDKDRAEQDSFAYRQYSDNMTVAGQLRRAGRDLDDLSNRAEKRKSEIIEEVRQRQAQKDSGLLGKVYQGIRGGDGMTAPTGEFMDEVNVVLATDREYRSLEAARREAEKRVQTIQHENDRQNGKDVGFWRGFGEVVSDSRTWDFGLGDMQDALTKVSVAGKEPNARSDAENAMLEQTAEAQAAEAAYGQNDSFWNRAGVMTGEMLPFMLDFALMGGARSGGTVATRNLSAMLLKGAHKAAPAVVRNKAAQWTVKVLGAMPEELLRATAMTNTVQAAKTGADIVNRKLGDVEVDKNGNYEFSNDKSWVDAVWQGEANAIIENYSEMFGTHLEGVLSLNALGKIADTFGAKRLSGILAKASNSELAGIAGTMQKHLNQLGVSDYFGEVGEEYYGQLWRTMLNLDDAYKQNPDGTRTNLFLDGQFHGDIWGGMALSMGLMGAGKYTLSAAAYGSMKHQVNKADARASEIFTPDVWEGWRGRIDGTTNAEIGTMAESIISDNTLTAEQKGAAMSYMEASLNLRGFNLGSVARQRGGKQSAEEAAVNESYMDGYTATTPQEMNDAKRMLDLQRQRLASSLSDDVVPEFDADPIGALSRTHDPELKRIAADYVNAKQVYDGMIQRVRDDIDGRIAQSDTMIDSRVNRETGMIQPATLKLDNRQVYIVNGTVSMYEDDAGIDAENSSESIIIRDAETGKVEFTDPSQLLNLGESIEAKAEKEVARNQIKMEIAQAAANNIDGVLQFAPGETYSVLDIDGDPEEIAILGDSVDEEGTPVDGSVDIQYPDGTIQSVPTVDLQQWVDAANQHRVEQFAADQNAGRKSADTGNDLEKEVTEGLESEGLGVTLQENQANIPNSENGNGSQQDNDEPAYSSGDDGGSMAGDSASGVASNRDRGYIRVYEEGLAAERDGDPGRSERARRAEESQRLVTVARQNSQYIDRKDFDSLGERRRKPSGESAVYINEEQGKVYKIKNPAAKSPMKGNVQPEDVIYEHLVHNKYFPETAYGFEGISDEFGDVRVVLSQDLVESSRQATKNEVESALAEKGLHPEGNYRYGNDEISVTDVTGDNALVGADGKVYFIDPIIDFKKPVREILPDEDAAPGVSSSALSRIPVDERTGVPMFEQVDADTAWDGAVEFVENEDDAKEYADSMVEQLTKDVATAEKNIGKVKATSDIAKFKAEKAAARQALADAQARLEHWTKIAGVRESRITEAQRQEAEAERLRQIKAEQEARQAERQARDEERASRPGEYARAMSTWEEPSSLEERILRDLTGGGIKLRWADNGNTRGLGAHLFGGRNTERRWDGEYGNYKWLVDDSNGLLPEEYAERLAQEYYNDYENNTDHHSETFDAALDILRSYASSRDMWSRVQELHQVNLDAEANAEDFERMEMEARGITEEDIERDRMYREQYGMSEDEWDEFYMTNGQEIDMSDEEFENLNTNLSELKADEQSEQQRLQQATSDTSEQGGASEIGADSDGVVREAGLYAPGQIEASGPEGSNQESSGDVSLRDDERGRESSDGSLGSRIAEAETAVNTSPTDRQKEAGNYKKGHVQVGTFDVTIENPKGSVRSGVDPDGTPWETTMTHTYGYIRGTKGVDGDHIDVYISSDVDAWNGRKAFVVDQYNLDGTFDEHKVMLGFNDRDEAFGAYLSNYESGWEKGRRLDIIEVNMEDFEKWIESSKRKTKPFAEYKNVKTEANSTAHGGKDPLHDEVRQWLGMKGLEATEASRSAVMRYFKIGYNRASQILNAIAQEAQEESTASTDGYTIVSKPYTNKQDKTLDTYLVTFDSELTKEDKKRLRDLAKSRKGWPDKETGGYMLRSREDAEAFAKEASDGWAENPEDTSISLSDIEEAIKPTNQENSSPETEIPEQKPTTSEPETATPVQETPKSEQEDKPVEAAQKPGKKPSKWVDEEDAEEFARLRDILRNGLGQLNVGFPPELLYAGAKMSYLMMKHGVRKFAEYATAMIEELGDTIRPHLKSLYNFTRSTEEVMSSEWSNELTPFDEVMKFDTANFDKSHVDALSTAENVVAEEDSQKHIEETTEAIKDNIRHNPDGSTTKTITEGGVEMDVTEGDFIPGILPAIDEQKPEKKPTKPKPATTGQLDLFGEEEEHIVNDVIEQTTPPEAKPEAELSGDSVEYQERARQERDLVDDIVVEIVKRSDMKAGGVDKGPLSMRDIRGMLENYDLLTDISATDLQELVERAMTILTRTAAKAWQADPRQGYNRVVAYYNMQPSLNARDSERLIKQQYSTPTPFGYVMGQFVNAKHDVKSVLEPSAGNGALTIMFDPSIVHVNDIDQRRLENLRTLGYGSVTAQNGLLPFEGEKVDGVLTNPPFGSVTEKIYDGIFKISSLEGQMAINALDSMKDGGRAAIIIGGNTSYRTNGSMNAKDAAFFGYLYSHYNVVDVININGKALYSRNGTGYDVRMILIDGRKTGEFSRVFPPVKSKARAEQVTTFDELYKRIQDDIQQVFQVGNKPSDVQPEAGANADGGKSTPVRSGEHRPDKGTGERPNTASNGSGSASWPHSGHTSSGNDGSRPVGVDNGDGGNAGGTDNVQKPKPTAPGSTGSGSAQNDGGRSGGNGRDTTPSRPDHSGERLAVKPDLTTEKVPYPNQSDNGFTLLSVVPAAQAEVLQRSLGEIGDVDQFLVDELGYSSKEELYSYLAAEQIDSVALAIHQMNKGNAFIIGDMTGVGKGRQGAALIRYGVRQGRCPIYFTQKPTLFTDNYRDLADIGSSELRPFIIASNPKDANIVDANGNVVHKLPSKKEQERVFDYIMHNGKLPPEYDYVLTTYDQIKNGTADYTQNEDGTWNTEARKLPKKSKGYTTADHNGQARRDALARLAMGVEPGKGNIAILDESHTVGGDSGCGRYMQMLTSGAYGVTFLSATFAKRADNMPIYAQRTAISEAGIKPNELIEAIAKGGVTLQEIMSKQLVESGQMIRRERSFEGVTIDWLSVEEATNHKQREQFNEVANIFNSIRNFQNDFIKPIIDGMNEAAAEQGATVGQTQGTKDLGVRNTPFASKMYNLVNQLLFALKVDAVADRVIENLHNGYKPVISFTNTMEGFLASAPKGVAMDEVPNFSLTLMRALDGVMRFTENDADQNSEGGHITLSQLSPEGQAAYNEVKEKIMNLSADLPISPMDAIRMKIEEAGYSVAEITGRTTQLNRTEDGRYIVEGRKDRDKKAAMRDFNSGKLDVLMINKSGSTGISLHASSKFEDQRQRVMVFAQFQSDINDEVQMRGRIDRSGQVVRGRYEYIMSTIPAEQRIQMMFKAKLKSLDANTTSSQKSKFNEMEIVDYLNKYGDEVVWEYMKEHPELSDRLGDPLNMLQDKSGDGSVRTSETEDTSKKADCAGKISRYLAFLSVEEQDEIFKEITEAYKVKIQLLDDAGENDLEITTMPLRAETKSKQIWHKGENPGSGNAFADNTYVEEVEVDVLKKPMKRGEIEDMTRKLMGDKLSTATEYDQQRYGMKEGELNWGRYADKMVDEVNNFFNSKADDAIEKMKEAGAKRVSKAREKAVKDAIKARAKGENTFSDQEIEALANVVAKEAQDNEEIKQYRRREEINAVRDHIKRLLTRLRAGHIYVVPQDLKQASADMFTQTFGTFVGFKFNKSYTLGSSTAIFATLDGRRKVELALNDKAIDTIIKCTDTALRYSPKEINSISMDNWDSKVPTQTRQTRHIITGNLLQALVDTEKGEKTRGNLISYSTMDGETRQGILMSENFKPTDLRNSVHLRSRLKQIQDGHTVVSENGDVQIQRINFDWKHRGEYELRVPKSKQRGGIYTMHPELLKLVGGHNFVTKGNNMVGYVLPENLAKVVDMLSNSPFNLTVLEESKLTENSAVYREGGNSYSDSELSYENDPWSKAFGESLRTKKKQKQFAERMRRDMTARANELANTLGVEIEIIEDASSLEGRKRKAKGWYDTATEKITIVVGNHKNVEDIEATMLHEVVAHHGLRELFGEKFDAFLDAVYENAENSIKEQIDLLATKNGWNRRVATEEYLAGLAERTDFENTMASWWSKIKNLFMNFLRGCGFKGNVTISDNELRYVLWMSWKNLQHPGAFKSFLGVAEKVAKEYELGVGAYAETDGNTSDAAEPGERFRDGDFTPHDRKIVANIYENMVAQGSYQFREATQDSMLGLKKLYEAILTEGDKSKIKNFRIEEVAGYENAYLYENRMSSANNGEQQQYFTAYMKPLLESVHNLCGSKEIDRRILTDYMMAKHGLERNEYMRNEAAAAGEETERDFAGLCGLTGKDDWQAAEIEAQKIVDDYENNHDTTELWDNVKRATTATLDKIYLTGLISEETYNKVLGMYAYYIPLRGWEETTSDEVYGYLTSKDGPLMGNVFKTAEGRESKADDPIATIAMMADDAIRQGNRNVMKQRFLNFVHGNPSDLVSVNELWLQYNDAKDEWQPIFADLEPDMTNAEVESEIAKFEAKMEALAVAEPDKYKRSRDARNIPYKVVRGNLDEHQVLVKRNGHTYVMTINGNPRAAQALNGLTNPNVEVGGIIGNMLKLGEYVNRNLSAFYTTRNPDFVMSNFLRDMLYSNAMTWVKENPRYALRFHRNFGKINPVRLRGLLAKWESNGLNDGIYIERMFKEFMLNGGETGYTSVKDIEGHKRTIAAELKKQGSAGRKAWAALGKQLDLLNRSTENCARFAAFLTSREMGRSLDRSIYDAKEISVNFNKKGSGGKFVNATGQTLLGKIGSYLGGGGRIAYVFWNAGVQGLTNFGRVGKRNPGKAMAGAAALFALGSVIPLLAQLLGGGDGDDDDKNAYYNLPEYVRRSNICFKAGDQWITIPLPIEYRAIYGLGELSTGVISGNERYSNAELARQMAAQVSQIMPLDMLEGGGGVAPFIPSAIKPFTEAYVMNKGWTGLPVYKDNPFNENDPEWTKAYQSSDQHLVEFTRWLNEISGGDDFKKGAIDINPAKLEYLLNGTFGGMVSFPMKIKKTAETAFGDREFEWRNMPFANRVVKSGDERTANRKLQNEYFKYKKEAEETDRLRKKYENAADEGILAYAEKIDFLYNSNEYLRYEIYKKFEPEINAIHEEIKSETDPETKKDLQAELFAAMRELVDELHEVGK
ncbi:MAG: strawberry notch C-terminal domain-containing protein [Staphylococcus sp.]|nr:strawberry notch C-terminal domain-containing protein [Staphylococcus sp.]